MRQKDSAQGIGRRSFLQHSIVGGLVLGTSSLGVAGTTPDVSTVCSSESFIDGLLFQLSQISRLQSKIMTCFVDQLVAESDKCRQKYDTLKDLIKQLEDEISRSTHVPNNKVSEVVELGQASVKLVQASFTKSDSTPYLVAAGTLNQQLASKASECLPDGGIILSAKATKVLRDIIAFVNTEEKTIGNKLSDIQTDHSRKAHVAGNIIEAASTHITAASKELILGENSNGGPSSATALRRSFVSIGNAVLEMRKLLDDAECRAAVTSAFNAATFSPLPSRPLKLSSDEASRAFSGPDEGTAEPGNIRLIDLIALSLEGIRCGIVTRYGLTISQRDGSNVSFRAASYQDSGIDAPAAQDRESIAAVMERHALAATPGRVAHVWERSQGATRSFLNPATYFEWYRTSLIAGNLRDFPIEQRSQYTPASYKPSLQALAQGIARLM